MTATQPCRRRAIYAQRKVRTPEPPPPPPAPEPPPVEPARKRKDRRK